MGLYIHKQKQILGNEYEILESNEGQRRSDRSRNYIFRKEIGVQNLLTEFKEKLPQSYGHKKKNWIDW